MRSARRENRRGRWRKRNRMVMGSGWSRRKRRVIGKRRDIRKRTQELRGPKVMALSGM